MPVMHDNSVAAKLQSNISEIHHIYYHCPVITATHWKIEPNLWLLLTRGEVMG